MPAAPPTHHVTLLWDTLHDSTRGGLAETHEAAAGLDVKVSLGQVVERKALLHGAYKSSGQVQSEWVTIILPRVSQ